MPLKTFRAVTIPQPGQRAGTQAAEARAAYAHRHRLQQDPGTQARAVSTPLQQRQALCRPKYFQFCRAELTFASGGHILGGGASDANTEIYLKL